MIRSCLIALTLTMAGCASPMMSAQQQPTRDQQILLDAQKRMNGPADPNAQPVETMTCAQMLAEMSAAGAKMSGQLDPSFAANARSQYEQMRSGTPGAATPEAAAANRARRDQMGAQVVGAMQGIDIQRMQAINTRFSAQKCPAPTGPSPQ
jgi:hypothetical protein